MNERKKRGNFILAGVIAIIVAAGTVAFQMTQHGQPTPPAQDADVAAQKR